MSGATSDQPFLSSSTKLLHRLQAGFIYSAYQSINGLLRALEYILWPAPRPRFAERVCVFRIGNIGDIVCALPAIRRIRLAYPNAQLTLLTSPGERGMPSAVELLAGNDWIDELRVYYSDEIDTLQKQWEFVREMRARQFDVWIDLPNNLSTSSRQLRDMLFTWLSRAKWARGWSINTIRMASQAQSEYLTFTNEVDRVLNIVSKADIPGSEIDFGLPVLQASRTHIDDLLRTKGLQGETLVAIAPGAKRSTNHWPPERFVEVGRQLVLQNNAIVLLGGQTEAELCRNMASQIGPRAHSFAGELSIPKSCEMLRRCRFLICVDSGVQHLAAAVGTPCISLFSFWQMRGKWHPYGAQNTVLQKWTECHTCLLDNCPNDNLCMKAIEIDDVVDRAIRAVDVATESRYLTLSRPSLRENFERN